ncbi:conserved hypothetical protein [Formosa agariphila KMM 3901]|uniref:Uncharacterized protein n=1 Tax=Formosa agariphila (strain DSM 15362 / KCTC 12365 / LMG 23005 / KMM 3901 / M-2Alg 35-1) TaxID=1347342 RepID=T2KNV8_FORAG|nr:hypothetical protein [Formosa agariphila]CDF80136.1 conserved hypothetical protein [Formosa agariphila KMM 3901]
MKTQEQINADTTQDNFNKKVLSITSSLHPYVKHRLHIAESVGILPKNLYHPNGVIDDCIIRLYEKGYDADMPAQDIKIKLFRIIDIYLEELFLKEGHHQNTISTNTFLQEELSRLDEPYSIDGDMDFVMMDELDDISYKQNKKEKEVFLYDENNQKIINALDLGNLQPSTNRSIVSKFYGWLPFRISNVVDLYVVANLPYEDISRIKKIEISRIENILVNVKKRFRKHLV